MSNQPPVGGTAPEQGGAAGNTGGGGPLNLSKRATRNYEVDKTLSHIQLESGVLRRLSVAVVVNDIITADEKGSITRSARTQEEIERITSLVKEAIGYTLQRGDSVRVINSAFHQPAPPEPLPPVEMWEEPWFWDVVRQVGGVLLVLLLIFGVLKPTMKKLATPIAVSRPELPAGGEGDVGGMPGQPAIAGAAAGGMGEPVTLPGPGSYEQTLDAARGMINDDPKRVAQVVKKWVAEDGG